MEHSSPCFETASRRPRSERPWPHSVALRFPTPLDGPWPLTPTYIHRSVWGGSIITDNRPQAHTDRIVRHRHRPRLIVQLRGRCEAWQPDLERMNSLAVCRLLRSPSWLGARPPPASSSEAWNRQSSLEGNVHMPPKTPFCHL